MPTKNAMYTSFGVCAFRHSLELANRPVSSNKGMIIGSAFMACSVQYIKKNMNKLLIEITCRLVLIFKKNRRYTTINAILVP